MARDGGALVLGNFSSQDVVLFQRSLLRSSSRTVSLLSAQFLARYLPYHVIFLRVIFVFITCYIFCSAQFLARIRRLRKSPRFSAKLPELRPVHLVIVFLVRILESNFQGDPL